MGTPPCWEPSSAPGTLDPGFGEAGIAHVASPDGETPIDFDLALEADGKLVYLGSSSTRMVLFRLNTDGTLDTTFGTDGFILADDERDTGNVLAFDSHGSILVGGGNIEDAWVQRFTSDGVLDATFGDAGRVTLDYGTNNDRALALVIRPDDTMFVGGMSDTNGPGATVLIGLLDADGATLTSPVSIRPTDNRYILNALAPLPDGGVLAFGGVMPTAGGTTHPFWSRIDDQGALAESFGSAGVAEAPDSPSNPLGVTQDALTVITSWAWTSEPALLGFNEFGSPLSTLQTIDYPQAVAVDCAGNVVVAGMINVNDMTEITAARFDSTGEVDLSFGGGFVPDREPAAFAGVSRVLIDSEGRIIIGGVKPDRYVVERYLP